MTPELFFDTFVEGLACLIAGGAFESLPLFAAGIEQISAGIISSAYTITHPLWFVSPVDFFTGCLSGGIISFAISKFVLKKDTKSALKDAIQSCAIGGLFAVSPYFGFAGIGALLACGFGKILAERDNKARKRLFVISQSELEELRANQFFQQYFVSDDCWLWQEFEFNEPNFIELANYQEINFEELLQTQKDEKSFGEMLGIPEDDNSVFLLE